MSIEAASQFWDAVNANEEWQEEIRNFTEEDHNNVDYAQGKGYAFTDEEYKQFWSNDKNGELSDFETELVAGGTWWCFWG